MRTVIFFGLILIANEIRKASGKSLSDPWINFSLAVFALAFALDLIDLCNLAFGGN